MRACKDKTLPVLTENNPSRAIFQTLPSHDSYLVLEYLKVSRPSNGAIPLQAIAMFCEYTGNKHAMIRIRLAICFYEFVTLSTMSLQSIMINLRTGFFQS
jgi:hypothetical protein